MRAECECRLGPSLALPRTPSPILRITQGQLAQQSRRSVECEHSAGTGELDDDARKRPLRQVDQTIQVDHGLAWGRRRLQPANDLARAPLRSLSHQ